MSRDPLALGGLALTTLYSQLQQRRECAAMETVASPKQLQNRTLTTPAKGSSTPGGTPSHPLPTVALTVSLALPLQAEGRGCEIVHIDLLLVVRVPCSCLAIQLLYKTFQQIGEQETKTSAGDWGLGRLPVSPCPVLLPDTNHESLSGHAAGAVEGGIDARSAAAAVQVYPQHRAGGSGSHGRRRRT